MTYTKHRDTQETLTIIDNLDIDSEKMTGEELYKKFGFDDAYARKRLTKWQKTIPRIWCLFEEPNSSRSAKVRALYTHCVRVPCGYAEQQHAYY